MNHCDPSGQIQRKPTRLWIVLKLSDTKTRIPFFFCNIIQVNMVLTRNALLFLMVIGLVHATCDECDVLTQLCVDDGESSYCDCRPALYQVEEKCVETKSYATEVEFAEQAYGVEDWAKELTEPDSEALLNLSRSTCAGFDSVLLNDITYGEDYYGCKIAGFYEENVGAIVLSFYKEVTELTSLELETILKDGLPDTFVTSSLTTNDANECQLHLDDCDPYLGNCLDTGAGGYECTCRESSEDDFPELPGRNCALSGSNWNIVYISTGAGVGVFLLLLFITLCASQFGGSSFPDAEKQKSEDPSSEKDKNSADSNDKRPLHSESNGDENGGVLNTAFETSEDQPTPENIFDVDDEQMAKLAHIHSVIANHHNRPAPLLLPSAQTSKQLPLERIPSVDYGPDYRPSSAVYQNSRQLYKYGKPKLARMPSGEYLEPMSISQRLPTRRNSSKTPKSRPISYNYGEALASSGIYETRFPSFVEKSPTSPTPSEPRLSRQSSSVFLPSSPRHSRNISSTSTLYYNR